jgi:FlaA1/EpsC-like NDP-sugar epimerase
MTRYFMSTPEAVQLVVQASTFAQGGEVFMLEMGEPANILDLAHRMIRLSGRTVGSEIAVEITGMRPGEKLTEELRAPDEEAFPTPHPSIVRLHPHVATHGELQACIDDLTVLVEHRQHQRVAEVLLSASNEPALLRRILARHHARRAPDDIRVIDEEAVELTEPVPRQRGNADFRGNNRFAELERSASWGRPNT